MPSEVSPKVSRSLNALRSLDESFLQMQSSHLRSRELKTFDVLIIYSLKDEAMISGSSIIQTSMFSRNASAATGTKEVWVGVKGTALTEPFLRAFSPWYSEG